MFLRAEMGCANAQRTLKRAFGLCVVDRIRSSLTDLCLQQYTLAPIYVSQNSAYPPRAMKRLKAEIDTLDRRSARRSHIFACSMRNERADLWVSSNNKTHWHEYKIKIYNIQNTSQRAANDAHDANDANIYTKTTCTYAV